jgi:hypothetical protein
MDCCVDGQENPNLPSTPERVASLDSGSTTPGVHAPIVPRYPGRTAALAMRGAPAHGHRHIDLSTLHATFLI